MQTLYGIKISDRVTVDHDTSSGTYLGKFDDKVVTGRCYSGKSAVGAVVGWLQNEAKERELRKLREAQAEAARQREDDDNFLWSLSEAIGTTVEALDRLIEIANRRRED